MGFASLSDPVDVPLVDGTSVRMTVSDAIGLFRRICANLGPPKSQTNDFGIRETAPDETLRAKRLESWHLRALYALVFGHGKFGMRVLDGQKRGYFLPHNKSSNASFDVLAAYGLAQIFEGRSTTNSDGLRYGKTYRTYRPTEAAREIAAALFPNEVSEATGRERLSAIAALDAFCEAHGLKMSVLKRQAKAALRRISYRTV